MNFLAIPTLFLLKMSKIFVDHKDLGLKDFGFKQIYNFSFIRRNL